MALHMQLIFLEHASYIYISCRHVVDIGGHILFVVLCY